MTDPDKPDYNDGCWHPWTGGDCPVHPLSTVEMVLRGGDAPSVRQASAFDWWHGGLYTDIVAFRGVTPCVEPAPEPVTPSAKRDLRTIDEPFYCLDEKTQARLRKADSKGWPLQTRGLTSDGITGSEWNAISKSGWYREETIRLDPTFTPPAKRRKWWIVGGKAFDSARQAKIAYPGSAPIKVKECKK